MVYVYFITCPGAELNSVVKYQQSTVTGVYLKFGDANSSHKDFVRGAYQTHNPDFGVYCMLETKILDWPSPKTKANVRLATYLKHYIETECGIKPNEGVEWFSVQSAAGWALTSEMNSKWDGVEITATNIGSLQNAIKKHLS